MASDEARLSAWHRNVYEQPPDDGPQCPECDTWMECDGEDWWCPECDVDDD